MYFLTVLCHRAKHPLQDVIVDNNVNKAEWVKVAPEPQ